MPWDGQTAAARPLLPSEVVSFEQNGFVVADGFLDQTLATRLASDARAHRAQFRPHQWVFAGMKLPKPGVSELDLHDAAARAILPAFHAFWLEDVPTIARSVCAQLSATLALGRSAQEAPGESISLKVQHNDGRGGCFPLHHDNPGPPSKRALTIVVYLNEHWEQGHGGEIVFVPFVSRPVAIAPLFNRAVLFRSELLLHGVLPATRERSCFTLWLDDAEANRPELCNLTRAHLRAGAYHDGTAEGVARFFQSSPLQRSIVRAVYAEEMSRDLQRCLRAADGLDEERIANIVQAHETAAAAQRANPELSQVLELLRELKSRVVDVDGSGTS